jgi:hypothetical protein
LLHLSPFLLDSDGFWVPQHPAEQQFRGRWPAGQRRDEENAKRRFRVMPLYFSSQRLRDSCPAACCWIFVELQETTSAVFLPFTCTIV